MSTATVDTATLRTDYRHLGTQRGGRVEIELYHDYRTGSSFGVVAEKGHTIEGQQIECWRRFGMNFEELRGESQ